MALVKHIVDISYMTLYCVFIKKKPDLLEHFHSIIIMDSFIFPHSYITLHGKEYVTSRKFVPSYCS